MGDISKKETFELCLKLDANNQNTHIQYTENTLKTVTKIFAYVIIWKCH